MNDTPNDYKPTLTIPAYASFNQHMLSSMIDMGIVFILLMPLTQWIVILIYGPPVGLDISAMATAPGGIQDTSQFLKVLWAKMREQNMLQRFALDNMLQLIFMALYVLPFWFYFAATPGKMLLRMEIRDDKTGDYMTRPQMVKRFLGYIVSAAPLMFGFVWPIFNKKRKGFHDYIAGTVTVVKPSWKVAKIN